MILTCETFLQDLEDPVTLTVELESFDMIRVHAKGARDCGQLRAWAEEAQSLGTRLHTMRGNRTDTRGFFKVWCGFSEVFSGIPFLVAFRDVFWTCFWLLFWLFLLLDEFYSVSCFFVFVLFLLAFHCFSVVARAFLAIFVFVLVLLFLCFSFAFHCSPVIFNAFLAFHASFALFLLFLAFLLCIFTFLLLVLLCVAGSASSSASGGASKLALLVTSRNHGKGVWRVVRPVVRPGARQNWQPKGAPKAPKIHGKVGVRVCGGVCRRVCRVCCRACGGVCI